MAMTVHEFWKLGYLQELNRQFLHPLGLGLSVEVDGDGNATGFSEIFDSRDDPEGMTYDPPVLETEEARKKADFVANERRRHLDKRIELFGEIVQPIPIPEPEPETR